MNNNKTFCFIKNYFLIITTFICLSSCTKNISSSYIGNGWSRNSVNTVKFRKNALTTHQGYQFVAYYDDNACLILGKRKLTSSKWITFKTQYIGNTKDAHNSISLAVDSNGYLHVSWDHHNTNLRYAKSKEPLELELEEEVLMTGKQEDKVTYPEFYNLPNGDLLFFYRSGESGRGNLVINSYDVVSEKWSQLQDNLIDGENKRSAYWQACIDNKGVIHVSWVWRETWGVETNHDLCYARSVDGGKNWEKSTGEKYSLPITLESAEYAWRIPQNSNLINQTAMNTDASGNPYIATYWNENGITQYQIVYFETDVWKKINTSFRKTSFSLGGGGTKRIPISRPAILIDNFNKSILLSIIYRDEERNNKVSLAYSYLREKTPWKIKDLSKESVGQWEPNFDMSLWKDKRALHVFFQNTTQVDGEGVADDKSSEVNILEIKSIKKLIKTNELK